MSINSVITQAKNTKLNFKHKAKPGMISIIIPVYNDASGLNETLCSLNKQILAKNNLEIIIANDGGDKAVTSLCKNNGLAMVEITPNTGSYFARNRAIENSRGEFIALVDADVIVPPHWLGKGLLQLQNTDYVAGDVQIDHAAVHSKAHYFDLKTSFPIKMYMEKYHFGGTGNLFVKRKVFEELGGFNEQLFSGGDNEFGNRVFLHGGFSQSFCHQIAALHPPRSFYEQVNKKSRTSLGMIVLSQLYPDRYAKKEYFSPGVWLRSLMPCSANTLTQVTGKIACPAFLYYFFYCWMLKICSCIKQVFNYGSIQKHLKSRLSPAVIFCDFAKK